MKMLNCKYDIVKIFMESVNAVNPARLVAENLRVFGNKLIVCDKSYDIDSGKIYLIGFGKAVLGMASQCEKILGDHLIRGIICVPIGIKNNLGNIKDVLLKSDSVIEVYEGAKNNLPDEKAEEGANAILGLVSSLHNKNDKLITLISGGGSALFPKALPGITLKEKLDTITCLTLHGANINELNTVRKRLSQVKGGGLAHLSYPVQIISLIISDVINNPLDIIASGPTVPNFDEYTAAFDIIKKYHVENQIPENVLHRIQQKKLTNENFVVDKSYPHVDNYLIGHNTKALVAAKKFAEKSGYSSFILSQGVNGFVDNIAKFYTDLLKHLIEFLVNSDLQKFEINLREFQKNCSFTWDENFVSSISKLCNSGKQNIKKFCIIAGGETTVKLQGDGKGGRNQELSLLVLMKLNQVKLQYYEFFEKYDVMFLSAGTDGIDGPTDVAGAVVDCCILEEAEISNVSPEEHLLKNDSYNFFAKIDNGSYFIKTGHTGTNVADVHILAICEKEFS